MADTNLVCSDCSTVYHLSSREGKICGRRLPGGIYCNGKIERHDIFKAPETFLLCSTCERRADNMKLERTICNFRLPGGQHCQGVLERAGS